ncbi:unnamed protein product [Amoebophrya sp. A25]|nr:unnamed protein product [Amoebophrya sp. A25]|eukprot:GSA25T00006883001.1
MNSKMRRLTLLSAVGGATARLTTSTSAAMEEQLLKKSIKDLKKQPEGAGDAMANVSTRVRQLVQLLQQLEGELTNEFASAQEAYDKQACEHEDTIASSKSAIKTAETEIERMDVAIQKNVADVAVYKGKIKTEEEKIAEKKQAIEDAIAQRKEEHTEYADTVNEFEAAIASANMAYNVLSEQQSGSRKVAEKSESYSLLSQQNDQKVFRKLKSAIALLPVNSHRLTPNRVEELSEFVDQLTGSTKKPLALAQFGPGSAKIMGILKDMRGEYVAKLQGLQESEQKASLAHVQFVEKTNKMIDALTKSKEDHEAKLSETEAKEEKHRNQKAAAQDSLKENQALLKDTTEAFRALARVWADTSAKHTSEMSGLAAAIDFLMKQGEVGTLIQKNALLQTSAVAVSAAKKDSYETAFSKIVWAIEDMVEVHKTEMEENIEKKQMCETAIASTDGAERKRLAKIDTLKSAIAKAEGEKAETEDAKTKAEDEKTKAEDETSAGQKEWEEARDARAKELSELAESIKLIAGAMRSLTENDPSGRFKNVIAILQMVQDEAVAEQTEVTKAKADEETAWVKEKKALYDLIQLKIGQIEGYEKAIRDLDAEIIRLDGKLKKTQEMERPSTEDCEVFLGAFQGKQDGLTKEIESLNYAKAELSGWQNQSVEAQHFDAQEVAPAV